MGQFVVILMIGAGLLIAYDYYDKKVKEKK